MAGIPIDGDIVGIPVELDFLMGNRYIYRIYSRLKYVHSYPNIWYYKKALLLLCRAEGQANTIRK
ncbi:hypothetical protein B5S25_18460 [Paenibacillus larvae subsp. pulvifaciens]|nr:hypothetical protein B5S25_18460 [Paenibacillus larvae subsp. pulvifaciens]